GFSQNFPRYFRRHLPGFDLVHAHGPWTYSSLSAVRWARRLGKPVLLTPHEGLTRFDLSHARLPGLRSAKKILKTYYRRHADAVVFSSPLELADSTDAAPWRRSAVIWHPVFDETVRASVPPESEGAAGLRIGMLGRFHAKKNIGLVIQALAGLPENVC